MRAGSHFAIKRFSSLGNQYRDEELGLFARSPSVEITQDQDTFQQVVEKVGKAKLEKAAGWLMEKASRLKLRRDGFGRGTFEALKLSR
jgi:hypothetical protein